MTSIPQVELPEMDIVLPGKWWTVDLSGDEAAARSVRGMAERLLGTHDRLARQRAEIRARITEVVDKARQANAANLYIAMELTEGLNVPITLAVYWPPQIVIGSVPSTPSSVIELVRLSLEAQGSSADYGDVLVEELGSTSTLRRSTTSRSAAEGDVPEVEMLIVDYWVAVPGTQRVVLLTFSTAFVQARVELLEMFRVMVSIIRWTEPRVTM